MTVPKLAEPSTGKGTTHMESSSGTDPNNDTRSTANEPGRLGDQSRRMDQIRSRITKDVIERLWSN